MLFLTERRCNRRAREPAIRRRRAAKPGETVIGESRIIHKGRQSMVCELLVTAGDGRMLAKGQSTALPVSREAFAAGAGKKGA